MQAQALEHRYNDAIADAQAALGQKDYAKTIARAEAALTIKPEDVTATGLRTEARTALESVERAKAQEDKYQAALKAASSALSRQDYEEAIKQGEDALKLKS